MSEKGDEALNADYGVRCMMDEWCAECRAVVPIIDEFNDQIGFEEQALYVHVVVLLCGHEIVTPAR